MHPQFEHVQAGLPPTDVAAAMAAGHPQDITAAALASELALLDLQWEQGRRRYSLGPIAPTRYLALGVAMLLLGAAGFQALVATEEGWHDGHARVWCCLAIATGVLALVALWYLWILACRVGEIDSQRTKKRLQTFLKWGMAIDFALENSRPPAWHKMFFCVAALTVLAATLNFLMMWERLLWVGANDLEITFHIVDAESGQPIAGALVEVPKCEGSDAFELRADHNGNATKSLANCQTTGALGWKAFFRRLDTYNIRLPYWEPQASAPGYQMSEPAPVWEFRREVNRPTAERPFATLEVTIRLHR